MDTHSAYDVVNALFEFAGAIILWLNVRRLHLDKQVKGVSVVPFIFYAAWGMWNPFYYNSLGQWFSCIAGIGVLTANLAWLALFFRYKLYPVEADEPAENGPS